MFDLFHNCCVQLVLVVDSDSAVAKQQTGCMSVNPKTDYYGDIFVQQPSLGEVLELYHERSLHVLRIANPLLGNQQMPKRLKRSHTKLPKGLT